MTVSSPSLLLTAAIIMSFASNAVGNVGIPLLMFRDARVENAVARPLAGHTIATDEFSSLLSKLPKADIMITFLQDELSNEDFLRFDKDMKSGGLFKNLKKYATMKTTTMFPSIKAPAHSLKTSLVSRYDERVVLKDAEEVVPYLAKTKLQKDTSVVIHLVPTADEETSSKAIKRNDDIVGEVMSLIEKTGLTYQAFFTGLHHRRAHEAVIVQGVGRHLLEAEGETEPNNGTVLFHNGTDCMIYAADVKVDGEMVLADTAIECDVDNNTATLKIGDSLTMTFEKNKVAGMWVLNSTTVKDEDDVTVKPTIEAPITFSFHCNEGIVFSHNTSSNGTEIKRLQIQVFTFKKEGEFGDAYDCTGFFTIPLWTGLLTALLLISVTIIGLAMLSNIQTFDLYDDPKSKPLTINVSE